MSSRAIQDRSAAPNASQAPKRKARRGGKRRGRNATILRRIDARARERQQAWAETGHPDLTDALTRKLGRDFSDLRTADRDDYAHGTPEGDSFAGKTQRLS